MLTLVPISPFFEILKQRIAPPLPILTLVPISPFSRFSRKHQTPLPIAYKASQCLLFIICNTRELYLMISGKHPMLTLVSITPFSRFSRMHQTPLTKAYKASRVLAVHHLQHTREPSNLTILGTTQCRLWCRLHHFSRFSRMHQTPLTKAYKASQMSAVHHLQHTRALAYDLGNTQC